MNSMNYKFIDTHCHLYGEYYDNLEQVLFESFKNDVNKFFVASDNISSIGEVLKLSETYENIYGCLGIHPDNVFEDYSVLDNIIKNISTSKIIAIGEIGLDYYHDKNNKKEQIKLFEYQLDLAQKYNYPVVIHSREATQDTINILKKYNLKGVIHCFNGSYETAMLYVKMGYKLGINGVITFKNCNLKDVIKKVGLEHLVLETDSPFLAPVPYRGSQNSPKNIKIIALFLANLFDVSLDEIARITNKNVKEIFDIEIGL